MDASDALNCFASLGQPTRLAAARLLLSREPHGLPAGEIARQLGVPQNTMSNHLGLLSHAGLVASNRQSRLIVYRASTERFRDLIAFLLHDCCSGRPELCNDLLAVLPSQSKALSTSECCNG
ncbi:MAG: metalloregulator ArsR/SmtB family transcription factor [Hyphomicrobiaceae bacterium]